MPLWVSIVAVIDGFVFVISYILRGVHPAGISSVVVAVVYWLTVWAGLAMAVYGFLPLTRGGEKELRRSVVCILFALIPACIGLITLLGHLGTPVGHT